MKYKGNLVALTTDGSRPENDFTALGMDLVATGQVPEPSTYSLVLLGLIGTVALRVRNEKRSLSSS